MKIWVGILSLAGASLFAQSGYRYESDDFGLLEVAGACSVSTDEVRCWDPSGKPNTKLSELVTAYFLSNPSSDLRLRFRKRNRLLVMRTIVRQNARASFYGDIEGKSGMRASQSASIGHETGQESHKLYWYYPAEDELVTSLTASLSMHLSSTSSLSLKEGSEAKLGAYTVKVLGITEASTNEVYGMGGRNGGKAWKIAYSFAGPTDREWPQIQPIPIDSKGMPIVAVDNNGNPTKAVEGQGGFSSYSPQLFYSGGLQGANTGIWYSRIRPDKIGNLALSGSTKRTIVFKDVALEPSP